MVMPHKLPLGITSRSKKRHHRDANIARMPQYPFEPMFQSMFSLNPNFRFDGVNLIINRNSLHILLRFVRGVVKENFRLNLAMVHNTLIVTPALQKVSENFRDEKNHGREFEDLFLQHRLHNSGTYHRVIRYDLGPLNIAVLSELDAALPASIEATVSDNKRWEFLPKPSTVPSSELSEGGQPNTRAEEILFGPREQTDFKVSRLCHQPRSEVIPGGNGTLSKDAAELSASALSSTRKMPQLWLGRVPFLVRGTYSSDSFTTVNVIQHATSFAAYENSIQDRLQKLVSLIGTLTGFARHATGQSCIALCDKTVRPRKLRIFDHHQTPPPPLPADIRGHFWANNQMGSQDSQ